MNTAERKNIFGYLLEWKTPKDIASSLQNG
jgi:hypothetical protein